jgi:hypothetical protein
MQGGDVRRHHLQIGKACAVGAPPGADALRQPAGQPAPACDRRHQYVEQPDVIAVDHAQREGKRLTVFDDRGKTDRRGDRMQHPSHGVSVMRRHRAQAGEACQPVGRRPGGDLDRGIGCEAPVEAGPLNQTLVDPPVATASQGGVRFGRSERRQAPDRRVAALAVGPFQFGHDLRSEPDVIVYRID